jgi:hypothetical protein
MKKSSRQRILPPKTDVKGKKKEAARNQDSDVRNQETSTRN